MTVDDKNVEPEVEQIQVLPLVALRDTVIFPRDDRSAAGRPRPQRQSPRPRGSHLAAGGAHHPAQQRDRGDQLGRRAVLDRHAGQDRPGDPPAGRHHPRHRPGPATHPTARPGADRAAPRGADRADRREPREDPGGRGPDGIGPGADRAVRQLGGIGAAGGGGRRPQHRRRRAAGRHGRLQPGHDHRGAPAAAGDDRRRRAAAPGRPVPGQADRGARAEGPHPERGQVRDGQDPARVHPARAAQGDPEGARRGRPRRRRGRRAEAQGRRVGDAGRGQGEGPQGGRPPQPDPQRLTRAGRHPHLRRLAGEPAVGRPDR